MKTFFSLVENLALLRESGYSYLNNITFGAGIDNLAPLPASFSMLAVRQARVERRGGVR